MTMAGGRFPTSLDETLVHVGGEDLAYCPRCGAPLIVRLIETEDRPRLMCDRGHILYVNPKLVVGVIPERRGRVLLLRRAIEPRHGFWTYPGGFMEIDETAEENAPPAKRTRRPASTSACSTWSAFTRGPALTPAPASSRSSTAARLRRDARPPAARRWRRAGFARTTSRGMIWRTKRPAGRCATG